MKTTRNTILVLISFFSLGNLKAQNLSINETINYINNLNPAPINYVVWDSYDMQRKDKVFSPSDKAEKVSINTKLDTKGNIIISIQYRDIDQNVTFTVPFKVIDTNRIRMSNKFSGMVSIDCKNNFKCNVSCKARYSDKMLPDSADLITNTKSFNEIMGTAYIPVNIEDQNKVINALKYLIRKMYNTPDYANTNDPFDK
jgi:hypothetical protein